MGFVGIGDEPAYAGSRVVAGSGFAERHFVAIAIETALAGAVEYSGEHAFANFRKNRGNIQIALDTRCEILNFLGGSRILQIIECAAICERSSKGSQLERRDLNAFAKAGHARDSTMGGRLHRERTGMLFRQIVAREFTQAEQARVTGNGVESHAAAQLFKKDVIGMSHRFGQIHVFAAAHFEHGVASDDIFFQGGEGDGGLDGGAGNIAGTESNFLIDDSEDAAGVGVDGDYGAVVAAKAFDSGGANDGIVKGADIGEGGIRKSWDAAKMRDTV